MTQATPRDSTPRTDSSLSRRLSERELDNRPRSGVFRFHFNQPKTIGFGSWFWFNHWFLVQPTTNQWLTMVRHRFAPHPTIQSGWRGGITYPKEVRRHWMRIADDTGRAVDAWRAFKGARLSEREVTPKDVLTDLFEEERLPDPVAMADGVIRRLYDAGFKIVAAMPERQCHGVCARGGAFTAPLLRQNLLILSRALIAAAHGLW